MEKACITGMGVVTPVGVGVAKLWEAVVRHENGFRPVRSFSTEHYRVELGAEAKDFEPANQLPPGCSAEDFGRATQFALSAAQQALRDAALTPEDLRSLRSSVAMGTTSGEPNEVENYNNLRLQGDESKLGEGFLTRYPCHRIAANLADVFGLFADLPLMLPSACAAGNYAIGAGIERIQSGRADIVLVGGADAFSRITYTGFARLNAISDEVCRPFDANRKGMIPGEGAGVLVLESEASARKRGVPVLAEALAVGLSCDAHHMTGSCPDGDGARRAMADAIAKAGIAPEEVDYLCAHGTGTHTNDLHETRAIKAFFGERARSLPVSSAKSMLGHTMGAASAIEAVLCVLALVKQQIPPTANFRSADEECDLDYVADGPRPATLNYVMSNAYAFGGANASVVLKRGDPVEVSQ